MTRRVLSPAEMPTGGGAMKIGRAAFQAPEKAEEKRPLIGSVQVWLEQGICKRETYFSTRTTKFLSLLKESGFQLQTGLLRHRGTVALYPPQADFSTQRRRAARQLMSLTLGKCGYPSLQIRQGSAKAMAFLLHSFEINIGLTGP